MTVEELKRHAETIMQESKDTLRKTGAVSQMFYLFAADGARVVACAGSDVTNNETAKKRLAEHLRLEIAENNVVAVIMSSDIYFASMNEEAERIKKALRLTVEQAANAGLCERHEAILVTLDSPLYQMTIRQEYRRDERDQRKITFVGDCVVTDNATPGFETSFGGRFMSFFPHERGAPA